MQRFTGLVDPAGRIKVIFLSSV